MKLLLLAGEESGRIYAKRLKELFAGCEVRGYGDYGFATGDLAVMGFWAVLKKIFFFIRVKRTMQRAIDEWRPDVVCTIDYPGMNLKLAAYAKAKGVRAVHVVCPQVWAWKQGRIPKIEASVDRLCCFFPFEPALFRPGFAVFVGHPLVEEFGSVGRRDFSGRGRVVALLPGSRVGEIERILPTMLDAVGLVEGVEAVVPAANGHALAAIREVVAKRRPANVSVVSGVARETLRRADCAVVASGTATLEAALARCPTVLVYRVSAALAWFARRVIKGVSHIGLVNVVWEKCGGAGEAPMPELLQEDFTAERTAEYVRRWLESPEERRAASDRLDAVVGSLGAGSGAFERIAAEIRG